MLLVNQT